MAQVNFRLPKLHVYFKTDKSPAEVRAEVLRPLANGLETYINSLLTAAGELGLTAEVVRKAGKVLRQGDRWSVYLKVIVSGDASRSEQQLKQAFLNNKSAIKTQIKARLERVDFGGTDLSFNFKRIDGVEAEDET